MSNLIQQGKAALSRFFGTTNKTRLLLLANKNEMKNGEMREVSLELEKRPFKVLLTRVNDEFHATSHLCSHYKARLVTGVLSGDGMVTCPWHAACFSVKTGDIEEAPAIPPLKVFQVECLDDDLQVWLLVSPGEIDEIGQFHVQENCQNNDSTDNARIVVVGGGAAGAIAVEEMRKCGWAGKITLISKEDHLPIDRIKLSKQIGIESKNIMLYTREYFEDILKVDLMLGKSVFKVDESSVHLKKDHQDASHVETIPYDRLLLAVGGDPKKIPSPLANIFTLRSIADNHAISEAISEESRVVIIGSSFIGMEAAAMLIKRVSKVTVVGMESVPFQRVLGTKVGAIMGKLHAENGVEFMGGVKVSQIYGKSAGDSTLFGGIELEGGQRIDGDVLIVGIGVSPATSKIDLPQDIEKAADGGIVVDDCLRANEKIWAAGDIASFPLQSKQMARIEHWNVAQQQGRIAGRNLINSLRGDDVALSAYTSIPFFFTMQFGKSIRWAGYLSEEAAKIHIDSKEDLKFAAYYADAKGCVMAVATMGMDPVAVQCSELMRLGRMPQIEAIEAGVNPLDLSLL